MRLGLLRRYRGMLLATPRGRKLRGDPVGLWWHLAEQLPPTKAARHVTHAWVPSSQPVTAPYSPGPRSVPGPHKPMSVVAFNSIFPNVRVAPLLPRYSVGVISLRSVDVWSQDMLEHSFPGHP